MPKIVARAHTLITPANRSKLVTTHRNQIPSGTMLFSEIEYALLLHAKCLTIYTVFFYRIWVESIHTLEKVWPSFTLEVPT
jgi:hypothetical protein